MAEIKTLYRNMTTSDGRYSIHKSGKGIDITHIHMSGISDSIVNIWVEFDGIIQNITNPPHHNDRDHVIRLVDNMSIPNDVAVEIIDNPLLIRGNVTLVVEVTSGEVDIMVNLYDLFDYRDRPNNDLRSTGY